MGLEHTFDLLDSLKNPQHDSTMIHVAGTNGKGSTCTLIANILKCSGKKVGLYTSPHLVRFNERIRVNGQPISDEEIVAFLDETESTIAKIESTFFEATTAMALDHFRKHEVDVAVIETGLGGRLDSTNVILPQVSVMTPISMDHMDILGETIEIIASEKAGIIKKGIPVICANQTPIVSQLLRNKCHETQSTFVEIPEPTHTQIDECGTKFIFNNDEFKTGLLGAHQATNASLAIETVRCFDKTVTLENINQGLDTAHWPGRIQRLDHQLYYDVAHNEAGLDNLLSTMKNIYPRQNIAGIFALKGDKDLKRLAAKMRGEFDHLMVVQDEKKLLLPADDLSQKLAHVGIQSTPAPSLKEAIKKLIKLRNSGHLGLVFGSHYMAEEVFNEFEIHFDTGII